MSEVAAGSGRLGSFAARLPDSSHHYVGRRSALAGGALAFEVLLTRLLAIIHWHHFAGMVISLALLGYGASGSVLTPLLDRLRPQATLRPVSP